MINRNFMSLSLFHIQFIEKVFQRFSPAVEKDLRYQMGDRCKGQLEDAPIWRCISCQSDDQTSTVDLSNTLPCFSLKTVGGNFRSNTRFSGMLGSGFGLWTESSVHVGVLRRKNTNSWKVSEREREKKLLSLSAPKTYGSDGTHALAPPPNIHNPPPLAQQPLILPIHSADYLSPL